MIYHKYHILVGGSEQKTQVGYEDIQLRDMRIIYQRTHTSWSPYAVLTYKHFCDMTSQSPRCIKI
jgi:hypothetical protein